MTILGGGGACKQYCWWGDGPGVRNNALAKAAVSIFGRKSFRSFGLGPVFCSWYLIMLTLNDVFVLTGLPITTRVYGLVASAVAC